MAIEQTKVVPRTGRCENARKPGGCPLHNLHCGYPKCDQFPPDATPAPVQGSGGEAVGVAVSVLSPKADLTCAMFHASDVPAGTKLYTHPSPGSEGAGEAMVWSLPEAEALVAFFGGSNTSVSVRDLPAGAYDDGSPRPEGKHAWCDECPEEGITYLGPYDPDAETPADQRLSREWMERVTSGGDDGFTADGAGGPDGMLRYDSSTGTYTDTLGAGEQAGEVELPPLPEAADELAEADGFNVIGLAPVFTAEQMRAYAASALAQARAECERLERLVYVPGLTECAKCGFAQVSTTLHVNDGRMSANNKPAQCPNGCGPLWRVTERDAGNKMVDRCEALQVEANRLREALRECEAITDRLAGERSYSMGEGIDALRRVFDTLLASGGEGGDRG